MLGFGPVLGFRLGKLVVISFVDSLTLALCERVSCLEGARADFACALLGRIK